MSLTKKYFEDLIDSAPLKCEPVSITKDEIISFAKKFDPQPFHTDETIAEKSIFGGLVASSLHTLSACTRSIVNAQGKVAILSGVGMDQVKMYNPVRPGDTLYIEASWSDFLKSKSKPERGFASIKCKVTNQKGELVVEYGYRYLIACRTST